MMMKLGAFFPYKERHAKVKAKMEMLIIFIGKLIERIKIYQDC
jgi:hypothetical protein